MSVCKVKLVIIPYALIRAEREPGKACLCIMWAPATFSPSVRNAFISGASKEWEVGNQGQEAAFSHTCQPLRKVGAAAPDSGNGGVRVGGSSSMWREEVGQAWSGKAELPNEACDFGPSGNFCCSTLKYITVCTGYSGHCNVEDFSD